MEIKNKIRLTQLNDFVPEKASLALIEKLDAAGFANPMLYGGALRDDYLRQKTGLDVATKDYDVKAGLDVKRVLAGVTDVKTASGRLKEYIEKKFPGCDVAEAGVAMDTTTGQFNHGLAKVEYKGQKIDIRLNNKEAQRPLAERIWGDAPINTIALDKSGVHADVEFETHAKRRVFQPYAWDDWGKQTPRFESLAEKIPGLMFINAPQGAVRGFYKKAARAASSESNPKQHGAKNSKRVLAEINAVFGDALRAKGQFFPEFLFCFENLP